MIFHHTKNHQNTSKMKSTNSSTTSKKNPSKVKSKKGTNLSKHFSLLNFLQKRHSKVILKNPNNVGSIHSKAHLY